MGECESQHLDAWIEKLNNGIKLKKKKSSGSDKQWNCKFCTKCFTSKSKLKTHIKYHNRKKSNKCEICSKCFTTVGNLKMHNRVHSGEKPYTCEVCSKSFSQSSHLKNH